MHRSSLPPSTEAKGVRTLQKRDPSQFCREFVRDSCNSELDTLTRHECDKLVIDGGIWCNSVWENRKVRQK